MILLFVWKKYLSLLIPTHIFSIFSIILQQKFIDRLDEKIQMKVNYKVFLTFDELVAEKRKYSVRLEAIEGNKDEQEFVSQISKTSDVSKLRESLELVEFKQLIEKQNESVEKQSESVKAFEKNVNRR